MPEDKKQVVTESDKIWSEISALPLNIFSLPRQTVEMHAARIPIPGRDLLLKLKSTAVLPALEMTLGSKYEIETNDKFTIVRRPSTKDADIEKIAATVKQSS